MITGQAINHNSSAGYGSVNWIGRSCIHGTDGSSASDLLWPRNVFQDWRRQPRRRHYPNVSSSGGCSGASPSWRRASKRRRIAGRCFDSWRRALQTRCGRRRTTDAPSLIFSQPYRTEYWDGTIESLDSVPAYLTWPFRPLLPSSTLFHPLPPSPIPRRRRLGATSTLHWDCHRNWFDIGRNPIGDKLEPMWRHLLDKVPVADVSGVEALLPDAVHWFIRVWLYFSFPPWIRSGSGSRPADSSPLPGIFHPDWTTRTDLRSMSGRTHPDVIAIRLSK